MRIVILGRDDETTRMVYQHLADSTEVLAVIVENKTPGWTVFKRRRKLLGLVSAFGQGLFTQLLLPLLRLEGRGRTAALVKELGLNGAAIPATLVRSVATINDQAVIEELRQLSPDYIIVNGTRIIKAPVLESVTAPFINIHLGWNPRYKGGNGGYWALVQDDPEHCGTTVHLIDEGIDTGAVLARVNIEPTAADTFVTYPLLQLHAGLLALVQILEHGQLSVQSTAGEPAGMWYHPTIWGYLWRRLNRGIK